MRKAKEMLDTLIDTHVEMAGATSPEAGAAIENARTDLHLFMEQVINAARGRESDITID